MNRLTNIALIFVLSTTGFLAHIQDDYSALMYMENPTMRGNNTHGQTTFITTWRTDNPGISDDNQITIPGTGTNYTIEWEEVGDPGNNGSLTGSDETLVTFPHPGVYRVSISGDFTRIQFTRDNAKILSVDQWGAIEWETMGGAFVFCLNLRLNAEDTPDLSRVTDMSFMFTSCTSMDDYIGDWDVSNVENMSNMFQDAREFNQPLEDWDVSNIIDMSGMFWNTAFNQPLEPWDVSKVKDMNRMFSNTPFNQPLESWDVSNVIDMSSMFVDTPFNQPLESWDVSKVTYMALMFASTPFNQPLEGWDVSNVQTMNGMFSNTPFNQPLGNWDVSNVQTMNGMFSNTPFNQPLENWVVSNVRNMRSMFANTPFNQSIDNWSVWRVRNMSRMFRNAGKFNQSLESWNVSNVEFIDRMFENAQSFDQNIGTWNLSGLRYWEGLPHMFDHSGMSCESYDLTLIGWNANPRTPNDVELGAEGIGYHTAAGARDSLINLKGWTIIGDQFGDCDSLFCDLPTSDISILGPYPVCQGEEVLLYAEADGLEYRWHRDGEEVTGVTGGTLVVTEPGFYTVSYTDEAGCESEESESVEISFLDETAPPELINGADAVLRSIRPDCMGFVFWEAEIMSCGDRGEIEKRSVWLIDLEDTGQYDVKSTDPRPDGTDRNNLRIEEELPFGTHRVKWEIKDEHGNELVEEQIITLVDMNPPNPVCMHGISTSLSSNTGTVTLPASAFDVGSWDDCTERENLHYSFSSDPTHTHHTWTCDDLDGEIEKTITVEIWVTNEYGHKNYCNTYVKVRDNRNACPSSITNLPIPKLDKWDGSHVNSRQGNREVVAEPEKLKDSEFLLFTPYPNPFVSHTVFGIELPHPGVVKLAIYNAYGNEIHRESRIYPTGVSKIKLSDMVFPAAGLYFYRIDYESNTSAGELLKME